MEVLFLGFTDKLTKKMTVRQRILLHILLTLPFQCDTI